MGSIYAARPDVRRELWSDTPAGADDEFEDSWADTPNWTAEEMAVDQEPPEQQQEGTKQETSPGSPDKAAGSRTLEQKFAEMNSRPTKDGK